jgi:hypothetical protein
MPLPLREVSFDLTSFTGDEFALGDVSLILTPTLNTTAGGVMVPAVSATFEPDADGQLTLDLVPGDLATPEFDYRCTVRVLDPDGNPNKYLDRDFGTFRVPNTAGPFVGADLIAAGVPPKAADAQTDFVMIGTGQSNMVGATGVGGGDTTVNDRVFAWDSVAGGWVVATLGVAPFAATGNNLLFHAGKRVQEATGKDVYLILVAQGGQPIARWDADDATPTLWNRIITEVPAALAAAGKNKVDRVLWHQGETDNATGVISYRDTLIKVKNQMRAQSWWSDRNTYMLCGEMAQDTKNAFANQILGVRLAAEIDPEITVVSSYGIPIVPGDEIHFSGLGLVEYGGRYGSTALHARPVQIVSGSRSTPANANLYLRLDGSGDFSDLNEAARFISGIKFSNGGRAIVSIGAGQWNISGLRCDGLQNAEFTGVLADGFTAPVKADFAGTKATDLAMLRARFLTEIVCNGHGLIANGGSGGAWRNLLISASAPVTNNYGVRTDDPNLLRDEQNGSITLGNVAFFGFDASGAGGLLAAQNGSIFATPCFVAYCDRAIFAASRATVQANNIVIAHTVTQEVFASGAGIDVSVFAARVQAPTATVYQAADYAVINARTADSNTLIVETRGGVVNRV